MKIEKINDRQIRCVLTKEDLENRKIRISELVCGGEKARGLLRDMMLQASRELGFSFNNNPLMIEAVPTGRDQLVLIITRVDDPGELDSRLHHLTGALGRGQNASSEKESAGSQISGLTGADDILKLLRQFAKRLDEVRGDSEAGQEKAPENGKEKTVQAAADPAKDIANDIEAEPAKESARDAAKELLDETVRGTIRELIREAGRKAAAESGKGSDSAGKDKASRQDEKQLEKKAEKKTEKKSGKELEEQIYQYTRFYLFRSLENVLNASKRVPEDYRGENHLFKNPDDGAYYLLVRKMDTDPVQFNRICNVLSEYSMPMDYSTGMDEFFREHMQVIVADHALQQLRSV